MRPVRGELSDLAALPAARGIPVDVIDVDLQPAARARYGHKIPVLLFGENWFVTDA